jgi:hypothetical protein
MKAIGGILRVVACLCVLSGAGCQGAIESDGASRVPPGSGPGADGEAGRGGSGDGGRGSSSPGAAPSGPATIGAQQPPRFACANPELRGQGQLAMRRLTRDELLQSMTAVVGASVMDAAAVVQAAARIPAEPPGDLVASFQNGHAFDHVEGLLLTAHAVAAEVAADTAARERLLGACAQSADRACAESFLDGAALRIARRPLDAARRASLLAGFDAEGGGIAGMQALLARVLQAPEAVFHLELPRRTCTTAPPPATQDTRFAWDDESVFFAPNGGAMTGPQAQLTEVGWYVWQIPAARITHAADELELTLAATSGDGTPIEIDVNLNDQPLLPNVMLAEGEQTLRAASAIAAGSSVKLGVYFKNAATGRALEPRSLLLRGAMDSAGGEECMDEPAQGGSVAVDDWSVASRLAYALTGEGPDETLLVAAARGELRSEDQVRPHAERLIATPAARRQLEAVLAEWLNLDAIPTPHPAIAERAGITPDGLPEEAVRELLDYAAHLILERDADTATLMTAQLGFPRSERMAALYGTAIADDGGEPVPLEAGHGGLLLRIAPLLSGQLGSSPILRGVYVRKRLLCDVLPSPDFSIVNSRVQEFEAIDRSELSTREAVTQLTSMGACPTCHVQINPLGFALESFDPLGQPRSEEMVWSEDGEEIARHPIDLLVTDANLEEGAPSELHGAGDLNSALAGSAKVRACIAERFYTHAQLRPRAELDGCALAEVEQALREGGSVKEAWLRAVVNRELLLRKAGEEVMP